MSHNHQVSQHTASRRWARVGVVSALAAAVLGGGVVVAGPAQAACLAPKNGVCPAVRQVPLSVVDGTSNTVAFGEIDPNILGDFLVPVGSPPGNPRGSGTNGCGNNSGQNACIAAPFVPTPAPSETPDPTATPPAPPPAPPAVNNPCIDPLTESVCGGQGGQGGQGGSIVVIGPGGGKGGRGGSALPVVPEPKPDSPAPIPVGQPTSPVVQPPPAIADLVQPLPVPPAASKEEAPVVGVQVGEVAVIQISDLPKRMPWTSQMSVGKKWYQVGAWKKTSYQGSATYPAFTAYKPGWYWLKAENKQGKCWWVKVRAYKG